MCAKFVGLGVCEPDGLLDSLPDGVCDGVLVMEEVIEADLVAEPLGAISHWPVRGTHTCPEGHVIGM